MRSSFRSVLLLGSAIAFMSATPVLADDPLVPEGAERPKMGKELMLPPIINEAPPGTAIVLPPPGQEHLLGERPEGAKSDARLSEEAPTKADAKLEAQAEPVAPEKIEAVAEAEPVAQPRKAKKRDRKPKPNAVAAAPAKVETAPVAEVPADKTLYAGIKQTSVPDQSLVVPEDASTSVGPLEAKLEAKSAGIVKTEARLDDAAPAMGGPELFGPPKPTDGMSDAPAPIRDGDKLTSKQERALAEAPKQTAKPKAPKAPKAPVTPVPVEPAKAPAIERFEIAQATAAPMPVTPGSARVAPDWNFAVSAKAGYAWVSTAKQRFQGGFATTPVALGRQVGPVQQGVVSSDDDGDAIPLELAIKANLEDHMEPLSIFGLGASAKPWLRVSAGGWNSSFRSNWTFAAAPTDGAQIVDPTGAAAFNVLGATGTANFRAKQETRGGKVLYGQTSEGSGVNWTGFGGVGYTERKLRHRIALSVTGKGSPNGFIADVTPVQTFTGGADTKLTTGTTSFILGIGAEVPLDSAKRLTVDAYGHASYDIVRATGRDTISLQNGATVLSGTGRLRRTDDSIGYGAGIGVNYAVSDSFKVRLGADYVSQEAAPVVVRDGVNPSRVDLEREDVVSASLTATLKY